jgi:hypothetical protein
MNHATTAQLFAKLSATHTQRPRHEIDRAASGAGQSAAAGHQCCIGPPHSVGLPGQHVSVAVDKCR